MRKIYDFSKFSSIYEAETSSSELNVTETEASKLYDQTLGLILTTILNSYGSELTFPLNSYDDNIDSDIISVKTAPILNKPAEMVKILQKVQKFAADNNLEGAKEALDAWVSAGSKATEALTAMINQYKDQPEELTHINNFINAKLDSFLEEIETAKQENDLNAEIESTDESASYEGEIFEGIFQGKKGLIGDVSRQIDLVNAKLASLAQTPGMASIIQKLQNEVTQISAKMGDLLGKSNKDINKEDIKKAAARLAEIPGEADKIAEKMLKEDSINKEASSILVQALALVQVAIEKEKKYLQKKEQAIQAETESAAKAAEKAKEDKVKVKVSDYIEFDPSSIRKVNDDVKNVQQLIIDKFGNIDDIKNLPQYQKFAEFGADGKFGQATQRMIKIIQKGLDIEPSGNISPDLVYKIQTEDIVNESARQIFKFKEFNSILESFKVKSAVDYAKSLPAYSKPSSSRKSSGSSSYAKVFKEGDKGPEVVAIQNAINAQVKGTDEDKNQLFGPKTKQAVMDWQKANGFTGKDVDGIVGPKTLKKMTGIKNLGTWTANMISKLSNVDVKPLTKSEESKVLSDAEKKEAQQAAAKLLDTSANAGTDEEGIVNAIKKIKNKKQFDEVNSIFSDVSKLDYSKDREKAIERGLPYVPTGDEFSSVQSIINSEFGWQDIQYIRDIADHLKSIGVNATFATEERGSAGNVYFKEDSFKIS